jgi:DNA repair protein RecO (recombination protein O)
MPSFKAKAVVLKTHNLGEADKILRLYSQEKGLIDAVAKGARKLKSKFGGRLELFNFIDCELSKGKSLDILTQAELVRNFKNISSEFNKFLFCQLICEIILKTHPSESESSQKTASLLFKLIYVSFYEINSAPSEDLSLLEKTAAFFIAKYLKITGYAPLIDSCCKCGTKVGPENNNTFSANPENSNTFSANPENNNTFSIYSENSDYFPISSEKSLAFSITLGGILCRSCSAGLENHPEVKKSISKEEFELISLLFTIDLKNYRNLNIQAQDIDNVLKIIGNYARFHAECNIDITLYLDKLQA